MLTAEEEGVLPIILVIALANAHILKIQFFVPFSLNKKWVELLAKSGTPLFISAPNGAFDEKELAFMKEMYKIASLQENVAIPLDFTYNATPALWSIDGERHEFNWWE